MVTSVSEHTYLHSSYSEVEPHCEISAHDDIWMVVLGEGSLELLQLVAGEGAVKPPLLLGGVMQPLLPLLLGLTSH